MRELRQAREIVLPSLCLRGRHILPFAHLFPLCAARSANAGGQDPASRRDGRTRDCWRRKMPSPTRFARYACRSAVEDVLEIRLNLKLQPGGTQSVQLCRASLIAARWRNWTPRRSGRRHRTVQGKRSPSIIRSNSAGTISALAMSRHAPVLETLRTVQV